MMSFYQDFDQLVHTFADLLVGESSPETVEQIKRWAIYNHIHKSMPSLTAHWTQSHPEAKLEVRKLFEDIRDRNAQYREKSTSHTP